jgi:hypothetical protein
MDRARCLRTITSGVLVVACAVVAGCGSGDGFPGPVVGPLQPTFSSIQANVFTPICEQCHAGASAPVGLRLDAANSYALLVGVRSGEDPGLFRVSAGDPNNSYLVQKLEGRASRGARMPAGLPPLPQATIDVIRQWITDGAALDAPQVTSPIRVTSLSPVPSAVEPTLPATITAAFDRDVNATTVLSTTFTLVRSGGDAQFGNGNDVPIAAASVTVPAANLASAVMSLSGVASVADTYRVTLVGSGPAVIQDLSGNALDGEFTGTFPSGNGTAGGVFTADFRVGAAATLQSIQDTVFTPRCAGCHSGTGGTLPGSMNLTNASASRTSLVGVASVEVPSLQRVLAGNANDSYLIHKLDGAPGIVGLRMPRGGPFLDQPTIDVIRQWINNGAQ